MASPIVVLKNSFAGGEVSPQLHSRVDLAKYSSWCKTLKNWIVQVDGSIINRPGTYYMGAAKYAAKECRLRKFVFSTEQAYQLEIGEYYIRFFAVTTDDAPAGQIQKYTTWAALTAYIVGDFILNSTTYYRCKTAHTSGATFVATNWESTSWVTATTYYKGDYVTHSGVMYYCIYNHVAGTFATDLAFPKWVAQTILETPTPYSEADLPKLKFTQSADILFIAHPDYSPKMLIRYGAQDWYLESYPFAGGPFQLPNTNPSILIASSATSGLGVTLTATAKDWITATAYQPGEYVTESGSVYECLVKHTASVFATDLSYEYWVLSSLVVFRPTHAPDADTESAGALFQLRHYVEGEKVTATVAGNSASINCGGTWRVISHGTWTGEFTIEKSTDNEVTWTSLRAFTSKDDFNVDTYGTEDMSGNAEPFFVRIVITAGVTGSPSVDLTTDAFYQEGIAQVTAYTSGTVVTADVTRTFANTTTTEDWTEGSWSDYRGWPGVVEFSPQDRLIWANTYTEPQTFWMTQTGNYYNFSRGNPLVDSDGVTINLPSREVNGINNLVPLTALLALTSSSEWSIGDPGTVLIPTSIEQRVNGYEGASDIDTVVIGNRAVFVQEMGSIVRDFGYELASYSFTGADLSILANHLFVNYLVVEMAYQKYPNRTVWCVRDDGKLLSMTYLREQEIVAWSWHETNDGTDLFESVSVAPANGYNEVWFVVNRGGVRYIERMVKRLETYLTADQFYMDCGITYDGAETTTITGLDHLEGKTVAVLADGAVKAQKVVSGGAITLDVAAAKVHVGLPYTSDVETLNVEIPLKDGSAQGRKMKVSQFVLGVYKSAGGWIGPTFDDLFEIRDNFVTDYGEAIDLYTGELKDSMGGGITDGARVCIRQIDPLPLSIRYIAGSITPGGMTGV